uniref:Alcohol dehydrogenase n=1 Tax=uncultured marine thaumarchaeote SAT1000_10_G09 TaxID=1456375 RepID=A0A075I4K4_9ARCH|nr:alcohol dehydrogenase [uncultured marine thaumarchaeote SAT1000_10_G09]
MRGKPLAIPLPHISGTDAAGEVIAVGSDVKNIKIGDRVVSHGNMSCRVCKACTDGREFDCKKEQFGVLRQDLFGEVIVNLHIYLKLMYLKFQKVYHMIKQQLHQ